MSPKRKRVLLGVFGVVCYLIFFYSSFPLETLVQQAFTRAKAGIPGFDIRIKEIDPGIIFDTQLEGVEVLKVNDAGSVPFLSFKEVTLDPSFSSLIGAAVQAKTAKRTFSIDMTLKGKEGSLDAAIDTEGGNAKVDIEIDGIDTSIFPYLKEALQLNLNGKFYGTVDAVWEAQKVTQSSAEVDIEMRQLTVLPSKLVIAGMPWDIPKIRLTGKENSYIRGTLQKGRLQLKQFELIGEEFEMSLNGRVQLNNKFSASRLYLKGKFRVSEPLAKAIPALVLIEKQKDSDGNYQVTLSGTVERPKLRIGKMTLGAD